jgi:hypothetical protein
LLGDAHAERAGQNLDVDEAGVVAELPPLRDEARLDVGRRQSAERREFVLHPGGQRAGIATVACGHRQ